MSHRGPKRLRAAAIPTREPLRDENFAMQLGVCENEDGLDELFRGTHDQVLHSAGALRTGGVQWMQHQGRDGVEVLDKLLADTHHGPDHDVILECRRLLAEVWRDGYLVVAMAPVAVPLGSPAGIPAAVTLYAVRHRSCGHDVATANNREQAELTLAALRAGGYHAWSIVELTTDAEIEQALRCFVVNAMCATCRVDPSRALMPGAGDAIRAARPPITLVVRD